MVSFEWLMLSFELFFSWLLENWSLAIFQNTYNKMEYFLIFFKAFLCLFRVYQFLSEYTTDTTMDIVYLISVFVNLYEFFSYFFLFLLIRDITAKQPMYLATEIYQFTIILIIIIGLIFPLLYKIFSITEFPIGLSVILTIPTLIDICISFYNFFQNRPKNNKSY